MTFKRTGKNWILDRFCSKNYTSVIGSFTKLLTFFKRNYNPDVIVSYSDNMISNGDIYMNSGFKCTYDINPTYSFLVNKKRNHRLSVEDTKVYPKIWNAGLKKWEWRKS